MDGRRTTGRKKGGFAEEERPLEWGWEGCGPLSEGGEEEGYISNFFLTSEVAYRAALRETSAVSLSSELASSWLA